MGIFPTYSSSSKLQLSVPHSPYSHIPWACQCRKLSQCNPVKKQLAVSGWGCTAHTEHLHPAARCAPVSWTAWQQEEEKKTNQKTLTPKEQVEKRHEYNSHIAPWESRLIVTWSILLLIRTWTRQDWKWAWRCRLTEFTVRCTTCD